MPSPAKTARVYKNRNGKYFYIRSRKQARSIDQRREHATGNNAIN